MPETLTINGQKIGRGEDRKLFLRIARLPTQTNIDLPVRVLRAEEPGPVLLLSGGLHGDELNGIEIVRRLLHSGKAMPERGTVIAIPLMNVYGFIQSVRGVPDGKDINRSFPGSKTGSLAKLVAYTIMNEIVPIIDYGLDFHTGGSNRANLPQIRCHFGREKNLELARAFSPPVIVHSGLIKGSFRREAYKMKKHILVYESGESLRYDENGIRKGIEGTLRLMHYLGLTSDYRKETTPPEEYNQTVWQRAPSAGLFKSDLMLGAVIKKRECIGYITDPFGLEMKKVISRNEGRVIGINYCPVVHKGDAIVHIARNKNE